VSNLLLDTPGGGHVRLGDVAKVAIAPAQSVIYREGDSRRIDVSADVDGRDLGSVMKDVDRHLKQVKFPLGYHSVVR
jgi:Cu/Ag efflux pump CusA